MLGRRLIAISASAVLSLVLTDVIPAQCFDWDPGFGPGGTNGQVTSFAVFDDGHGPALYAGGYFTTAGSIAAKFIARWDGTAWAPVGGGVNGGVEAMLEYDDGTGPALYVAGNFRTAGTTQASRIAKWDGSTWSALGVGLSGPAYALTVYDDGNGAALYVGGGFGFAGGGAATGIAKWDGAAWSALGPGLNSTVTCLAVFDPGTGSQLYAGGYFSNAGAVTVDRVASWDGSTWSPVGGGADSTVRALATYDTGSGMELYAGGELNTAGGVTVHHIGRWDGTTWSAVGGGTDDTVRTLRVFDHGTGSHLYAGGFFTTVGGLQANRIASWDGGSWSPLGSGMDDFVLGLGSIDEGGVPKLFVGGQFSFAGGIQANRIARWNGSAWAAADMGSNLGTGIVQAFEEFNDGTGRSLYAGGRFDAAGGTPSNQIAKWTGSGWSPLANGITGGSYPLVRVMKGTALGGGPSSLYVGGDFTAADGVGASNIARWDGQAWWPLGVGTSASVEAMTLFDDGRGRALFIGGGFTQAGGTLVRGIARWDGSGWSTVGAGFDAPVQALAVFDDGSGEALFAGGVFSSSGGHPVTRIAKWDGTNWLPVGGGIGPANNSVTCLTVYDSGSGPQLYAAGAFSQAGAITVKNIARWNGITWSDVGGGMSDPGADVRDLRVFDDGYGPALYATGSFTIAGGVPAHWIAKWNGSTWAPLGSGLKAPGNPMHEGLGLGTTQNDGHGNSALFVGGSFSIAGGFAASGIALWHGCGGPGEMFCAGDGSVTPCPCANTGGPGHGCQNSSGTGGSILRAGGNVSPDSVVLTATGELPTALSVFLQGTANVAEVNYGDGLRCAGGELKRLFTKTAGAGVVVAPEASDPTITARSAALGDPLTQGATRFYQVYYRDSDPNFCPAPTGNAFNISNGVRIVW